VGPEVAPMDAVTTEFGYCGNESEELTR